MAGVRPEDVLSDEEIDAHLETAFDKFESSGDRQLGEWEFTQCWVFLGLKAGEDEIKSIFKSVDQRKTNDGTQPHSCPQQDAFFRWILLMALQLILHSTPPLT